MDVNVGTGVPLEDEDANEEEGAPTDEEVPALLVDDTATLEEETTPPDDEDEKIPPLPDDEEDDEEALAELVLATALLEDVPPAEDDVDDVATKPDVSLNAVEELPPLATREELFEIPPEDEVATALLLELVGPPLLEEVSEVLVVHARQSTPTDKPSKRFMRSPVRGLREDTAQQMFPPCGQTAPVVPGG